MKALSGKEFARMLESNGWTLQGINGSHHIYAKAGSPVRISVPIHGNDSLKVGLQRHLMKLSPDLALGPLMAERRLPVPDVFATCPADGKIFDYYSGFFEAVLIVLHPFIMPVSIRSEQFVPPTYPGRLTIVQNCAPVSWADVASKAGLPSIATVDIGLRTMIGGLRVDFSNQDYADKVKLLGQSHQILPPPEGCFSDLPHDEVLQTIQGLGYEWVWVGDEFETERKLYWIEDLKGQDAKATAGH